MKESVGYWIFSTYSLGVPERELTGVWTLKGKQDDYWQALTEVNAK